MNETPPPAGSASVARLREWVLAAKPGATMVYARGRSCRTAVGELVCNFVARIGHGCDVDRQERIDGLDLVTAHFTRDPQTREGLYLIKRTAKPLPRGVVW